MSNKEAIKTLEANYPDACFGQLREAVDAAIEALKAQDADSDTISRQAAIDYCYQLINVEHQQGSDEMNYGQERVNQTETILHHLEFMPSAQPDLEEDKDIPMEYFENGGI